MQAGHTAAGCCVLSAAALSASERAACSSALARARPHAAVVPSSERAQRPNSARGAPWEAEARRGSAPGQLRWRKERSVRAARRRGAPRRRSAAATTAKAARRRQRDARLGAAQALGRRGRTGPGRRQLRHTRRRADWRPRRASASKAYEPSRWQVCGPRASCWRCTRLRNCEPGASRRLREPRAEAYVRRLRRNSSAVTQRRSVVRLSRGERASARAGAR